MKTADEIGKKLKISGRYVRKLAERREIPFYRVGPRALRFDESEVVKAIKCMPATRGGPPLKKRLTHGWPANRTVSKAEDRT